MKKNSNSIEPEFKRGLTEEEINSPEFNPDDFAPAPEDFQNSNENENLENRRNALAFAFIVALFALIIGLVGWGTKSAVNAYEDNKDSKLALSLFENCNKAEEYKANKEGYKVYAVFYKDKMAGYCVFTTTDGFGGKIDMIVGFNSDNMINNIRIVDHNESRGLGSQISGDSFLSQFKGLLIGNSTASYDLIAGATTSSKAVGESVKKVLGLGLSTESIAKELGYETITEEEIEEEVKKEEENNASSDTTDSTDTTRPTRPGDVTGGGNINQGDGDINIDGEDETTVYDTETTEQDEETSAPEETTGKPVDTTAPDETTAAPDDTTVGEDTTTPDTTAPDDTTSDASEDTTSSDSTEDTTAEDTSSEAVVNESPVTE